MKRWSCDEPEHFERDTIMLQTKNNRTRTNKATNNSINWEWNPIKTRVLEAPEPRFTQQKACFV